MIARNFGRLWYVPVIISNHPPAHASTGWEERHSSFPSSRFLLKYGSYGHGTVENSVLISSSFSYHSSMSLFILSHLQYTRVEDIAVLWYLWYFGITD